MLYAASVDALHRPRLRLDTPAMRELSVAAQRYRAVMAVLSEGRTVGNQLLQTVARTRSA